MKRAPWIAASLAIVSMLAIPSGCPATVAAEATFSPAASAAAVQSLDNRIVRVGELVDQQLTDGRINIRQADDFHASLELVTTLEAQYRLFAKQMTLGQLLQLDNLLDHLEVALNSPGHDRLVSISDTVKREESIGAMIKEALAAGRLNEEQAAQLNDGLKRIVGAEAVLRAGQKDLSYADLLVVSFDLDNLAGRFAKLVRERNVESVNLDQTSAEVKTLLDASKDKLGVVSSRELQAEFDRLQAIKAKLNSWKSVELKNELMLSLAAQLDRLGQKIEAHTTGITVATVPALKLKELDKQIAEALVSGRLTPVEAHEFSAELKAIGSEPDMVSSSVNASERTALELERLSGRVGRSESVSSPSWTGIDRYLQDLQARIAAAEKASRISGEQSVALRTVVEKIGADRSEYQKQGINAAQALDLAIRAQRVNIQLEHDLRDRNVSVPDIAALQLDLDKLVADGVDFGQLSAGQQLNERLGHIKELQANYAKSPGGLDDRAKLAVAEDIARTMADIRGQIRRDAIQHPSLDSRIGQLQKDVSNAVAMGIISVERATQYKAAVDIIYGQSARARQHGLTAESSLALASDISLLEQQLQDELREDAVTAGQLSERCRQLEQRVGRQLAVGRLSLEDANQLVAELHKTADRSNDDRDGGISHGEGLRLSYDIAMLSNRLEDLLHNEMDQVVDLEQKEDHLDAAIANGLISGRLAITKARVLKQQLNDTLNRSEAFHISGAGMSYLEALALSSQLERLRLEIADAVKNGPALADIDQQQADLKKRIKLAQALAKLNNKDAQTLSDDLDRIEQSELAFRTSEESLNFAEALTLSLDLDRVRTRFDSLSKGQLSLRKK